MAQITYKKMGNPAGLQTSKATVTLPMWGVSADLVFQSFVSEIMGTALTITAQPTPFHNERASGCSPGNKVLVRDNGRQIEQNIILPTISGQIFGFANLRGANNDLAKIMGKDLVGKVEKVYETGRRSIRDNFSSSVRHKSCKWLSDIWEKHTTKSSGFLKDISFPILLNGCGVPDDFWGEMFAQIDDKNPTINSILLPDDRSQIDVWDGESSYLSDAIAEWRAEQDRIAHEALMARYNTDTGEYAIVNATQEKRQQFVGSATPTGRAIEMLSLVCGQKIANEFIELGHVSLESNGYKFRIRPGHGDIRAIDPNGKSARLCIGAFSSVNIVDDVCINVLNCQHNFDDWFATANILERQPGFLVPDGAVKKRKNMRNW